MPLRTTGTCDLARLCGNTRTTVYMVAADGFHTFCADCWPDWKYGPLNDEETGDETSR